MSGVRSARLAPVGDCPCAGDGGEVPRDNSLSARCRFQGLGTSTLVSSVHYDLMALLDQQPGRHEAEAVR
jgi:hypothetical protein